MCQCQLVVGDGVDIVTLLPLNLSKHNENKTVTMPCANTMKASVLLVRKLYTLMQNLGPLPDNMMCLNMKLSYYDDGTTHIHTTFFAI